MIPNSPKHIDFFISMNFEMINLISRRIRKTQRDSKFSRGQKDRLVTPTTNRRRVYTTSILGVFFMYWFCLVLQHKVYYGRNQKL